jgi:hypothetical protein
LLYSDDDKITKTVRIAADSSDDDKDEDEDDKPTDDITGDEFIPTAANTIEQSLAKNSRVFAKWLDGCFYPGVIGNINGEK